SRLGGFTDRHGNVIYPLNQQLIRISQAGPDISATRDRGGCPGRENACADKPLTRTASPVTVAAFGHETSIEVRHG
ncbi:MAG: hypothetical protein ACREIP_12460, partial [Alphaproteobacteria bacterium]